MWISIYQLNYYKGCVLKKNDIEQKRQEQRKEVWKFVLYSQTRGKGVGVHCGNI